MTLRCWCKWHADIEDDVYTLTELLRLNEIPQAFESQRDYEQSRRRKYVLCI